VYEVSHKNWTLVVGLTAWLGLGWLMPIPCAAQDVYGPATTPKSSVSGSIKQGFNKVGDFFTPKSNNNTPPVNDSISLNTPSKPSAELYTAIGRLYEDAGNFTEAEKYFQMALKEKPNDLGSMLAYARFQENQGRINDALALYQKAVQTHPKEAGAYNNLGLCYARRNKLNEADQALSQAVQLDPRNPLYRNNLATVEVDQNRLSEAFATMREIHSDAVANYNMGYLLNKQGKTEAAEHYFAQALMSDPKMAAAQKWLNYLHDKSRESAKSQRADNGEVRLSSTQFPAKVIPPPASAASDAPPLPPAISSPQRLPPVSMFQSAGSTDSINDARNPLESNLTAPLPPVSK
jgi:tetratricopeptide (TPR) repeat protein